METPVGFGPHKVNRDLLATRELRLRNDRERLCRVLDAGTTVAFVGSGCSAPLGYPVWAAFVAHVVAHTRDLIGASPAASTERERLERFAATLAAPRGSDRLMFMLGQCRSMLHAHHLAAQYDQMLATLFAPRPASPDAPNPYDALLALPLRRFVTSNYDCELERALHRVRHIPEPELRPQRDAATGDQRVFTQSPEDHDLLALFVLAGTRANENRVFHCHGHHAKPDTLVVTEADYQRWYLRPEPEAEAFRQSVDLLFGSNPILFVGFGLGDEDLLRPLRRYVSERPDRRTPGEIFALFPEADAAAWDYYDQLHDRFGVRVVTYPAAEGSSDSARGRALCDGLLGLERDRSEWHDDWLRKPAFAIPEVKTHPPHPYRHYALQSRRPLASARDAGRLLIDRLLEAARGGARVIALVGRGGVGKSWTAMELLERVERGRGSFQGTFFWSSYYTDDLLTGIDRALAYLEPAGTEPGPRIERLLRALHAGKYLLVFDGVERLMLESDVPEHGKAHDALARGFFRAIADPASRSTVILTSRLWPGELGPAGSRADVLRYHIERLRASALESSEPFAWFDRANGRHDISALTSLLEGHAHAVVLAAEVLRAAGPTAAQARWHHLRRALTHAAPEHRLTKMTEEAIRSLDADWAGLAGALLDRLALFMSPVPRPVVEVCHQSALAAHPDARPTAPLDALIDALLDRSLLHAVTTEPAAARAYTSHPIVRGYVFLRRHLAATDSLPNLTLAGYTAGTAITDPGGPASRDLISDVFGRLTQATEQAARNGETERARALLRSAFSAVRSRMASNTVPRWTDYDGFHHFIVRLLDLANRLAPRRWDYADPQDAAAVQQPGAPLHAEELAWLYNEAGLASHAAGMTGDAIAVWEQGLEINRMVDSSPEAAQYVFQSECNLGAAFLERGRLGVAERFLRKALATNHRVEDEDHQGRILGYLGLIEHLRGNLDDAAARYAKADAILEKHRNNRGRSEFLRHHADLKLRRGDPTSAADLLHQARALAEASHYPDLVAFTRAAEGHWHRAMRDYQAAQRELASAMAVARRCGIRKLEVDILFDLSRVAFDQGDYERARQLASESLRIANACLLGLRQTHALIVLGKAAARAGQRPLGLAYLRHARALAASQEYRLREREAEACLHELGGQTELA